jgi:pyridinium-3,5-bisthiocarboxylic acid mononucleotide nickel chelatase
MYSLYFDCKTGISGDMVVGSLLDLGLSPEYLSTELKKLPVNRYTISVQKIKKINVLATKFNVVTRNPQPARHLPEILEIIDRSKLECETKKLSTKIFTTLAKSEAFAHDTSIEEVHFHEIGAIDSIIDIVSASILLNKLEIKKTYCGTISVGNGTTESAHGLLPVPTPAVKHLLRDYPTKRTDIQTELTTPTGAAIIKTIAKHSAKTPNSEKIGFGAGTKDLNIPNVLESLLIT